MDLAGDYAFLASGKPGLLVVDISDPENPKEVGRIDTPLTAKSIKIDGSYAYVGDLNWVRVFDISNPSAPREIASYETPSYADHIAVSDGTAYVAGFDAGLMILALTDEETQLAARH